MSREAFLADLNLFFDGMAGAVLEYGGEVLRFIGDAVLAIFPLTEAGVRQSAQGIAQTCYTAIEAVREAERRLAETNAARAAHGMEALRYGIGLHIGEVTYGNIGTNERLEFTVIGAAANEAARIEALCDTGYAGPVVRRLRRKFSRSSDFGRAACLTRHRRRTRDLRRGRSGPLP